MKKRLDLSRVLAAKNWGDTIVEVMISMAVLAVVVGAAYAISTRSYQSGVNSQYRDQAVSYAQQQLELIKEAEHNSPSTVSNYTVSPGTAFCINPSNKSRQTVASGNCVAGSQYTESIIYDSSTKTFKVTTSWDSADNHPQQSTIYYKASNSFAGSPVACTSQSASCVSTVTAPPSVGVSAAQSKVVKGSTDNISWSTLNIKPGSCSASGPGGFGGIDPNTATSPYATTALTTTGANTFSVSCTDNAGNPVAGSVVVTVVQPPTVTVGSASSVTYNSATLNGSVNPNGYATTYVFSYGTTSGYGTQTAQQSVGAGASSVAASANISSLSYNTTYHFQICATNTYGTVCSGDATFATTNPPAPVITAFYANPSSISYGAATYLYWSSTNTTSCSRGGPSGNQYTGALTSTTTYSLTCSGPGGTAGPVYATVSVGPPPPPSSCNSSSVSVAGTHRNSDNSLTLVAAAGGCQYYSNNYVGWNGGGVWVTSPGQPAGYTFCQNGGWDPWGFYAQSCTWI